MAALRNGKPMVLLLALVNADWLMSQPNTQECLLSMTKTLFDELNGKELKTSKLLNFIKLATDTYLIHNRLPKVNSLKQQSNQLVN